jgi:Tfp pilus assembly protein PilF
MKQSQSNPNNAAAHLNQGLALAAINRFDDALASYDRALAIQPDNAQTLTKRGTALRHLNRFNDALASFDRALLIKPDYPEALCDRGTVLLHCNLLDDALASYDRALAIQADYVRAICNRGTVLVALNCFDDALASYERALVIKPDYVEALSNRGNLLRYFNRIDDALASYALALAIQPDYADAHLNEGLCRLTIGDFDLGWQKYEWRWKKKHGINPHNFSQPLWLGQESLQNKTILLHAEQGLGDTIQFCRYAQNVAALGATVILEVQPSLKTLLRNVAGVASIIAQGEKLPAFDVHCPLLSLPLAFHTDLNSIPFSQGSSVNTAFHPAYHLVYQNIASALLRLKRFVLATKIPIAPLTETGKYLTIDATRKAVWKNKLGLKTLPRVGLVWSGNLTHANDRNRSIPLPDFAQIINPKAQFFSLQKELRAADKLLLNQRTDINFVGDDLKDFADTAALIDLMDLVITVDTSIAHLAGAMGKPVWILLPFNSDWRWLLDRNDSPWYPSARLFRQLALGNWHSVIATVKQELCTLVSASSRNEAASVRVKKQGF